MFTRIIFHHAGLSMSEVHVYVFHSVVSLKEEVDHWICQMLRLLALTHSGLVFHKLGPGQNAASDQGLHCLLAEISIKIK